MFFSGLKKISGIVFLILLIFSINSIIRAESSSASHQVTVTIQDMCRYRVEDLRSYRVNQSEKIEEATISVLSNSRRTWQLTALTNNPELVEWSLDGQTWRSLNNGAAVILSGTKSSWNSYHIYYRLRETTNAPQIQYQIFFES